MWESMGPIADRTVEHLGASDLAITQFRRQMLTAARRVRDGGKALKPGAARGALASFEGITDKSVDWRTLGGDTAPASLGAHGRSGLSGANKLMSQRAEQ